MKTFYSKQPIKNLRLLKLFHTNFSRGALRTTSLLVLFFFLLVGGYTQTITLLSPNGGEEWMTGTTQNISWQLDGGYSDLYIEYTNDDIDYWYYLAYVSAFDSISEITVTNNMMASASTKLRISLYDDESVFDESDSTFIVTQNPVYFYTPSAGEQIYSGVDVQLSWYSYTIDTFNIDYSTDNGASWTQIASSLSETYVTWTTPSELSDQCMIRVSDFGDSTVFGLSPVFSLVEQPTATISTPNGGETWEYGNIATVSWTGTNLPYYLYLDYSDDGGITWDYLGYGYGTSTGGSVDVYVPYISSDSALVRITDPYYGIELDRSDDFFSIYVPPVIMYYPSGGEAFYIKESTWISWLTTGVDFVNIELSTDGGSSWTMIEQNYSTENSWFQWTIAGVPSTDCYVRVSDTDDSSKFGLSGQFTLLETPVITLSNPVGSEIWNTDSTYNVSWSNNNPDSYYAYIDYSSDNGQTWNYIGYGIQDDNGNGSIEWKTPLIESNQYLIRVTDSYLNFVSDTSGLFTINTFPATPICIVSVDSTTNQNMIIWEKPVDDLIDSFSVYKESDVSGVYEKIGAVAYMDSPVFMDTNSNPAIKSYRYRLGFSDASGNEYPMSTFHQTIHLAINKGVGNSWNLIWTNYEGIHIPTYNIYRSANGSNYSMIATISASFNTYTDVDAPQGNVFYFVEVINENGCEIPARGISNSISNIATNNVTGIDDEGDEKIIGVVYPNPADKLLTISFAAEKEDYRIQVYDLTGRMILSREFNPLNGNNSLYLATSQIEEGVYFLTFSNGTKRVSKKIIINHR